MPNRIAISTQSSLQIAKFENALHLLKTALASVRAASKAGVIAGNLAVTQQDPGLVEISAIASFF